MRFVKRTNEEFLQELHNKNIIYTPLEEYKSNSEKIWWFCPNCKNKFLATPSNILNGKGCSYCVGKKAVLIGYNDMWTTNPMLAKLLKNPEDGYKYRQNSNKHTDWVCPICNSVIYDKRISFVNKQGLFCSNCSDGISYPEKFVSNLLSQLNVKFKHDVSFNWSNDKRYDFYVEELSLIIECHGKQHYENGFINIGGKSAKEQHYNDIKKRENSLLNGIHKYIELDCRISEKNHIKESIMNSELLNIFDLHSVNWEKCNEYAISGSKIIEVCKLWNKIQDTKYISDEFDVSRTTVIDYLKKGNLLGLCKYNAKTSVQKSLCKSVICIETGKIYLKIKDVIIDGFTPQCVSGCCKGKQSHHKGHHFKYYGDELGGVAL